MQASKPQKGVFFGLGDLEIWPTNGPPRGRQLTQELKSAWIDPRRAPGRPLEPSYGRFPQKSIENH